MRVASWNLQALRGASADNLESIAAAIREHSPDVVALQEVHSFAGVPDLLSASLAGIGLPHFVFTGTPVDPTKRYGDKKYGNVVAARWPLEPIPWPVPMEWPQLIAAARVRHPRLQATVVSVHIPNGRGNGWEKVFAFEALRRGLDVLENPVVVAGDFNEPRSFEPFLSFRATKRGDLTGTFRDLHGVTHARQRWQRAVEAMLATDGSVADGWGGSHIATRLGVPFEVTHLVGGRYPRYFDHILARGDLTAKNLEYDHTVRTGNRPPSDHSMVIADLRLGTTRES
jgi:endonuclease/exonuclease/phosphatase family metal-dependent hydrolase